MVFGVGHYVPVLKVKRGEKKALGLLSSTVRKNVTPLLEVVERTDKTFDRHLDTAFTGLVDAVYSFDRCFIDTHEIASDGPKATKKVFQRAMDEGIVFTPVVGMSRSAVIKVALEYNENGIALRLMRDEFEAGGLEARIQKFVMQHELVHQDIDLIVDLGPVEELIQPGVEALAAAFFDEIPEQNSWKTLTLSACAFPRSLGLDAHSNRRIERLDWLAWKSFNNYREAAGLRLPTYSDYAIQHPAGVEGFDPRFMHVSASVRYTNDDSWLLIKGESLRRTSGKLQFKDLATQLVYGHLRSEYAGETHCQGCKSIKAAADGAAGHGSPEVWRRHGTIHHIVTVAKELGALPWS